MRAREFVAEAKTKSLRPSVAAVMPAAYNITSLPASDAYLQYRFGVAIASAKGRSQRKDDGAPEYTQETQVGRNQVVVGYDNSVGEWIQDALMQLELDPGSAEQINSGFSHEPDFVKLQTHSPIQAFPGFSAGAK